MKRLLGIMLLATMSLSLSAQDLSKFKDGFTAFAQELAPTLSYNATVGNNWSDAYIGNLPHFGVGAVVGATTVPAKSLETFFTAFGQTMPAALKDFGLPIPALAVAAKIGGIILPFDIGVKGMILPAGAAAALASSGIEAKYTLLGANVRFGVLKENLLLPDVSVGAAYSRLDGGISVALPIKTQSFTYTVPAVVPQTHTISMTDPKLDLVWGTNSFDFTAQVSKSLLFVRPFAGIGATVGSSSVKGGLKAQLLHDNVALTAAQVEALKNNLSTAGIDVSDLSPEGFLIGNQSTAPAFRLYGGVSLDLIILVTDVQVQYVLGTGSLGGSVMIRVQL